MKIFVVGSSKNDFLPLDDIREKFLIDEQHDGDNIDSLNPWYCELTGLYYLWKHCDDDIVGLEHYRRYFVNADGKLLSKKEILEMLNDNDIITPVIHQPKTLRDMVSNSELYTRFIKFAIKKCPAYGACCETVFDSNTMCLCNMFICRKEVIDEYCEFIFELFKEFKEFETFCQRETPPRYFGYLGEEFFRAYLLYKKYKIKFNDMKFCDGFRRQE